MPALLGGQCFLHKISNFGADVVSCKAKVAQDLHFRCIRLVIGWVGERPMQVLNMFWYNRAYFVSAQSYDEIHARNIYIIHGF